MKSPLDISVSCFKNYRASDNPEPVNLMSWLRSAKYADQVKQIRSIDDKSERDKLKATLPGITPSGTFTYRNKESLIEHSGLIQVDIDLKGNEHISNYDDLKSHLCNINNVAYCGLSVSGRGYWGLVPIKHPNKHKSHFKALKNAFGKLGLTIDASCSDVSRLRGYSWDPDGYFNHDAGVFTLLNKPPARKVVRTNYDNDTDVEALINQIQASRIDITGGYDEWLKIGFAFADEFGEVGRDYFHAVSQYHSDYNEREADRQYTHCLKGNGQGVTISTFFYLAKQYGITLHSCDTYHSNKKDRASTGDFESRESAPYGKNPYSGEIFDKRGYPSDWDDIEFDKVMKTDPMISQIIETFDCEIVSN